MEETLKPLFRHFDRIRDGVRGGAAVLTPNRRLSRAVRASLHDALRKQGGASISPSVLPLRQYWIEAWRHAVVRGVVPPARLIDSYGQRLLWQKAIEADAEGQFSLLSSSRAAALAQEAAERLRLWRLPLDAARRREFGLTEDGAAFLRWHDAVAAMLKDRGLLVPELALEALLSAADRPMAPLILLETDDIPPLYAALIGASHPVTRVQLFEQDAAAVEAVVAFDSELDELTAAARWARQQVMRDPQGRYAVVLTDMEGHRRSFERLLRREFNCLTSDYGSLPVNFSTGFKLAEVPLVRDALGALSLGRTEVSVEDSIAVLQSRFLKLGARNADLCERASDELRALGREHVPRTLARQSLEIALGDAPESPLTSLASLEGNARLLSRRRLPSAWTEPFAAILRIWGWPEGRTLDSLEFQQVQQWQSALDGFAGLDGALGELDYDEAISALRRWLTEQVFQPQTVDSAVQVLGPLETTGLSFDGLWVTGLSADQWPASPRPNPYLPHALQRHHRMPHADAAWEWNWSQQRWKHWLGQSKTVEASFQRSLDGSERLPSPLLEPRKQVVDGETAAVDARWARQRAQLPFESVDAGVAPLRDGERAKASVGAYALESQAACPFRAFASERLRASPSGDVVMGLSPPERGSMLHRALQALYEPTSLGGDGAVPPRLTGLDTALDAAEAVISAPRRYLLGVAAMELERKRLHSVLREWIAFEAEHSQSLEIVATESERSGELSGLSLRLRLDRVDRDREGRLLVVDYKSGAGEATKRWFDEGRLRPQLPLYALLEPAAAGVATASLKVGEMRLRGVGDQGLHPQLEASDEWAQTVLGEENGSLEALRSFWRQQLEQLAADFAQGEASVAPAYDACTYCQRFELCRLAEELA
ncbi:MAG: PD-(D/E)XK nuclease family protein [Pseudomonadota bacterium]